MPTPSPSPSPSPSPVPRAEVTGEVAYIGGATIRKISADEFLAAGVKSQAAVRWDASNKRRVPVDKLSSEALAVLLDSPREFVIAKPGEHADLPVNKTNPSAVPGE